MNRLIDYVTRHMHRSPTPLPRASLDDALYLLHLLKPWAAPRLPAEELARFDDGQRLITPADRPPSRM